MPDRMKMILLGLNALLLAASILLLYGVKVTIAAEAQRTRTQILASSADIQEASNRIASAMNAPPRWEYTIMSPADVHFEDTMKDAGAQGWELVEARRATTGITGDPAYEMIFKRPAQVRSSKERR